MSLSDGRLPETGPLDAHFLVRRFTDKNPPALMRTSPWQHKPEIITVYYHRGSSQKKQACSCLSFPLSFPFLSFTAFSLQSLLLSILLSSTLFYFVLLSPPLYFIFHHVPLSSLPKSASLFSKAFRFFWEERKLHTFHFNNTQYSFSQ